MKSGADHSIPSTSSEPSTSSIRTSLDPNHGTNQSSLPNKPSTTSENDQSPTNTLRHLTGGDTISNSTSGVVQSVFPVVTQNFSHHAFCSEPTTGLGHTCATSGLDYVCTTGLSPVSGYARNSSGNDDLGQRGDSHTGLGHVSMTSGLDGIHITRFNSSEMEQAHHHLGTIDHIYTPGSGHVHAYGHGSSELGHAHTGISASSGLDDIHTSVFGRHVPGYTNHSSDHELGHTHTHFHTGLGRISTTSGLDCFYTPGSRHVLGHEKDNSAELGHTGLGYDHTHTRHAKSSKLGHAQFYAGHTGAYELGHAKLGPAPVLGQSSAGLPSYSGDPSLLTTGYVTPGGSLPTQQASVAPSVPLMLCPPVPHPLLTTPQSNAPQQQGDLCSN